MFAFAGIEKPEDETIFKKPRLIEHKNTRFKSDPFKNDVSRAALAQAASESKAFKGEKVGHDGKAIIPHESPRVGGYGFVATPSPMPGWSGFFYIFAAGNVTGSCPQLFSRSVPFNKLQVNIRSVLALFFIT